MLLNIPQLRREFPILDDIIAQKPLFWLNPKYNSITSKQSRQSSQPDACDIEDARKRLERFCPYIASVFPETRGLGGIIESPLMQVKNLKEHLKEPISGNIFFKLDSHLPISGSIKARGGIYEVLKFAESIALKHGVFGKDDNYSILAEKRCFDIFQNHSLMVGSTGNLGLSIGIMGAKLGLQTTVHMSVDAKPWKKDMLRAKGVRVIEYQSDYSLAVAEGRKMAEADPLCHFIDDEDSQDLFLGYAVAGARVAKQLHDQGVIVTQENPLVVYLPCGVGGGPGGVAFGLKQIFGDAVHCFFAEPVASPAMLLGLTTGLYDSISGADLGIENKTIADGLAVSRPSGLVARIMDTMLTGSFTVEDNELYRLLYLIAEAEDLHLEPSAVAGIAGIVQTQKNLCHFTKTNAEKVTHLVWATGGSMVPKDVWAKDYSKGKELAK